MYAKLLVPLDGSERAEAILPHVESLAKRYRAEVIFLFVEEPPLMLEYDEVVDPDNLEKLIADQRREIQAYFDALVNRWRAKEFDARVRYRSGPVIRTIIDTAQRENVDLVAMASHGRSGLMRAFYGSVAAGVLNQIDRPLLLVRSRRSG